MAPTGNIAARDLRVAGPRRRLSPAVVGLAAGLAALVLYAATGSRGVEWQDSGIHQYRILTGRIESPLGLALSHPLHYWLGRLMLRVPLGDPIHKLNLLSGLCGAAAVGVLAGVLTRLTRSALAAGFAAAAVGLAHAFWQMSALTETYTLAAMLMTIEWALLLGFVHSQRPIWLVGVLAVNGLQVADHLLGLFPLLSYVVLLAVLVVRGRVRPGWLVVAAGVWLLTASCYWTLVLAHWQRTGDLAETVRSALFGGSARTTGWTGNVLNVQMSLAQIKLVTFAFIYCFPCATAAVACVGLLRRARGRRRIFHWVLLGQTLLICVFVGRYRIPDVYKYFVPICAVTALWFGWGVAGMLRRWRVGPGRWWLLGLLTANALLPVVVYFCFPILAASHGWLAGQLRDIPYRDEYQHFFRPWRHSGRGAATLASSAMEQLGSGGWLIGDNTTAFPVAITYLVQGGPPAVRVYWFRECLTDPAQPPLTDDELGAHVRGGGRVLLVPSALIERQIPPPLEIDKSQPLWRVVAPTP
ncbi:MAG: DUF2723 domain-containing protein [Phycisphaerae bacterium]|nr:DUF2723 domain-containing protein [Phycisphaerae bacterium]